MLLCSFTKRLPNTAFTPWFLESITAFVQSILHCSRMNLTNQNGTSAHIECELAVDHTPQTASNHGIYGTKKTFHPARTSLYCKAPDTPVGCGFPAGILAPSGRTVISLSKGGPNAPWPHTEWCPWKAKAGVFDVIAEEAQQHHSFVPLVICQRGYLQPTADWAFLMPPRTALIPLGERWQQTVKQWLRQWL